MKLKNKDINFHNFLALNKKMRKFDKAYEDTDGKPLLQARIEKSALSVQKRLDAFKREDEDEKEIN